MSENTNLYLYCNMKSNFSIIISIISITISITVIVLWICNCIEFSVIDSNTFIGTTVALLALLFTIFIGYQIINAIEIREKFKNTDIRQNQIESNYQNYLKLANNLQAGICNTTAELYHAQGLLFESFVSYHSALYFAICADQPNQLKILQNLKDILLLQWNRPISEYDKRMQEFNGYVDKIRNSISYRNCLSSEYEFVLNLFIDKIRDYHSSSNNC